MTLELVACVMITIRFVLDVAGVFKYQDVPGPAAMALCILLDGPALIFIGLNGGTASLVVSTLERYWKIVHAIHHREHYRRWMLYVGLFLPWFNGVASYLLPEQPDSLMERASQPRSGRLTSWIKYVHAFNLSFFFLAD